MAKCPHTMKADLDGKVYCCDCGKDMTAQSMKNNSKKIKQWRIVVHLSATFPTAQIIRDDIANILPRRIITDPQDYIQDGTVTLEEVVYERMDSADKK